MTDDRAPARPLWQQVLDDLEDRLTSGDIATRFPTDRELVEHYGVSRHTVREAVRRLKARGVIARERGRGSVVTGVELVQPLGTLYSLFSAVEAQGMEQRSEVVSQGVTTDASAAAKLGLPEHEELFHVERIRYAGTAPLAVDTVWLPAGLGATLEGVDLGHTALYDELEQRAGVRPTEGEEIVTAVLGDDDLRALLEVEPDEAVLRIARTGRHDGQVVECRLTWVRGSRFALRSAWPDGGTATPVVSG